MPVGRSRAAAHSSSWSEADAATLLVLLVLLAVLVALVCGRRCSHSSSSDLPRAPAKHCTGKTNLVCFNYNSFSRRTLAERADGADNNLVMFAYSGC